MPWFVLWWVFPLVGLATMMAFSFRRRRPGWHGRCASLMRPHAGAAHIQTLEEEVERLRQELAIRGGRGPYR